MFESLKKVVFGLSSMALCATASAIVNESANPYQGIVDRNVFGLKPPPPITDTKTPPVKDPPPITLTGMTTILSTKRVLLNVQSPGKAIQSFILAEGQRDGDIEVLEIDEKAGSVKLNYGGTTVPLNFEKNGPKLTASAAAPGVPGVTTLASAMPAANVNPVAPGGLKGIPTRNWTPPAANQPAPMNNANAGINAGNVANAYNGVPSPGFGSVPGSAQQAPPPPVDPDVQAMQMLTQHVEATDAGVQMPPLPPPLAEVLGESPPGGPPAPQQGPPSPSNRTPRLPRAPGQPMTPPPLPQ
jgi:hypothetical protein